METLEATAVAVRDVDREYRESIHIARGLVIGISASLVLWGVIVAIIVIAVHLIR